MSESDFKARLPSDLTAFTFLELSNKESTASCNIRFSFLKITSGALMSIKRLRRLLRMITRRYKSFKSEVAKRPPSNGTNGLNSGGITGTMRTTIHSGRFSIRVLASRKASTTFNLLRASALRC